MSDLIIRSSHPLNAETTLQRLRQSPITPTPDFYIRCHGDIPDISPEVFRLSVTGRVARPLRLTLQDLRERFPERTVPAVLQCAGNRRGELNALRPVSGDPWSAGAIGQAEWTGWPLHEILHAAGADDAAGLCVAFTAADVVGTDPGTCPSYAASIPLSKALSPDVLLAHSMNKEPLTPVHGYPLRAIVPGYAGVRSVKWVTEITVRDSPADGPIQRHDYKLFPPEATPETADWEHGPAINEMPLNAAICAPVQGETLPAGRIAVRGYALAPGSSVSRVEVSTDGGRHWQQASFQDDDSSPWCWRLWETQVTLDPGEHELLARAWDDAGNTQPESPEAVWNFKGYLCSAWHRVRVRLS